MTSTTQRIILSESKTNFDDAAVEYIKQFPEIAVDDLSGRGGSYSGALVTIPEDKKADFDTYLKNYESNPLKTADLVRYSLAGNSHQSMHPRINRSLESEQGR